MWLPHVQTLVMKRKVTNNTPLGFWKLNYSVQIGIKSYVCIFIDLI